VEVTLWDQGGVEPGEVIDEVAEFIKKTRQADPDYEYNQGSKFVPPKDDSDDGWLSTPQAAVQPECDSDTILIKYGPKRKHWSITFIGCGRCRFSFERTKVSVARSWAVEHNDSLHGGSLTIVDSTKAESEATNTTR
jgi:hypothetical protein